MGRAAYASTASRLASWGFAVATYDKAETALDPLDDVLSADIVLEIMDYVEARAGVEGSGGGEGGGRRRGARGSPRAVPAPA